MSGSWFRRSTHNERRTDNLLVCTSDYFPVNIMNPLDGQVFTVYNLNPASGASSIAIDVNSTDGDTRSRIYNGFELGMSGRLHGASFFGGWTFDRLVSVAVRLRRQPEQLPPTRPRRRTSGWCDQRKLDIPLSTSSSSRAGTPSRTTSRSTRRFRATPGRVAGTLLELSAATRYPAELRRPCPPGELVIPNLVTAPGTSTSMTLALQAPGTTTTAGMNQLDLGFRKLFRVEPLQ